jgi:hypothetical protein
MILQLTLRPADRRNSSGSMIVSGIIVHQLTTLQVHTVLTEVTFDPSYSYATSLPSAAGLDLAPACEGWSCEGSDYKRSEVMLPRQASH